MDRTADVIENFFGSLTALNGGIRRILKLLRNKDMRVFFLHAQRGMQTFLDARADVARIMDQNDLGTVVTNELSSFLAYRVGHDDDRLKAHNGAHEGKADALITAGRLYYHGVLCYNTAVKGVKDHIVGGSCLYRSAYVKTLVFY